MLHHVSLEVAPGDLPRAIEFWQALGFTPIEAPAPLAGHVTWLAGGASQIHLIHTPAPTVPGLGHPAVVARPFDATVAELRRRGFTFEEARELWGEARGFAVSPGGQRVELMAAPPPAG